MARRINLDILLHGNNRSNYSYNIAKEYLKAVWETKNPSLPVTEYAGIKGFRKTKWL